MCTEFLVIRATLRRRSYLLEDGQCFEIQPRWTVLCTLRHVTGTELQIPVKLVLVFCRHLGHAREERSWFSSCSRWPTQRSWAHHQQPCHQQLWLAQLPCVWPARMTVICLRPATALQLLHDLQLQLLGCCSSRELPPVPYRTAVLVLYCTVVAIIVRYYMYCILRLYNLQPGYTVHGTRTCTVAI